MAVVDLGVSGQAAIELINIVVVEGGEEGRQKV
jgi:hypothetical protein